MAKVLLDGYRRQWPRVAAVQGMALGGASLLAGRKTQKNLRALSVMNAMTMCAHQYEEYVDPGYFPGMVNVGIFKSDQPRNYPYNPNSAMCANVFFRALYVPPILFPKQKWLGIAPSLLGIVQAVGHVFLMPRMAGSKRRFYSPGALTAALLHLPIGITYLTAASADEPIGRKNWIKGIGLLVFFLIVGVALPNLLLKDKDSPYEFPDNQMGEFLDKDAESAAE